MSCKGLWTSRIPDMKCPFAFVKKKNQGHNMGRAMVTIFWDLGGVILVDFTQGASCHHGMLTRLKEAIFEGSVVFTLYCLTTHWSHHSEPLGTLGMKRFFLVLVVPYLARLDFQMFLKIMKHLQGLHLHNDKNVRE